MVVHNSIRLIICTAVVIVGKKAGVHIMERGQFNDKSLDYISGHRRKKERKKERKKFIQNRAIQC